MRLPAKLDAAVVVSACSSPQTLLQMAGCLPQGRMYVFEEHICFYTNLFGYVKLKVRAPCRLVVACWDAGPTSVRERRLTKFWLQPLTPAAAVEAFCSC